VLCGYRLAMGMACCRILLPLFLPIVVCRISMISVCWTFSSLGYAEAVVEFITPVNNSNEDQKVRRLPYLSLENPSVRRISSLMAANTPKAQSRMKAMTPDLTAFDEDKVQKKTPRLAR
jgi:hypothetical protein